MTECRREEIGEKVYAGPVGEARSLQRIVPGRLNSRGDSVVRSVVRR